MTLCDQKASQSAFLLFYQALSYFFGVLMAIKRDKLAELKPQIPPFVACDLSIVYLR